MDEGSQDVVAEVSEAQSVSSEVLKASIDGLDWAVRGAHIEVGENLGSSTPQRSSELCELG